jgi:hypothetical protein
MNFMNFMNFRYKSSTYSVNAVKKSMNQHEPFKIKDLRSVAPGWFGAPRGLGLNVVDLVLT